MNSSLLQRQVTQFDTTRTQASIATPTCSSCCCCCCCLGTAAAATVALPIDVSQRTPKKTAASFKKQAVIIATAAVPITILFWIVANNAFPELSSSLISLSFFAVIILAIPLLILVLAAYMTASTPKPGARALVATAIITGAIAAEAIVGTMALLAGMSFVYIAGALIFAVAVPASMLNKKNGKRKKTKKDTRNYDTW